MARPLTAREKWLILLTIGLVVVYSLYRFVFSPQWDDYKTIKTQLLIKTQSLAKMKANALYLKGIMGLPGQAQSPGEQGASFPDNHGIILLWLNGLAHEKGLELTSYRPVLVPAQEVPAHTVEVDITGPYPAIAEFFNSLHSFPFFTQVNLHYIKPLRNQPAQLSNMNSGQGNFLADTFTASFEVKIFNITENQVKPESNTAITEKTSMLLSASETVKDGVVTAVVDAGSVTGLTGMDKASVYHLEIKSPGKVINTEFTGDFLSRMAARNSAPSLDIKTSVGSYILPVKAVDWGSAAKALGENPEKVKFVISMYQVQGKLSSVTSEAVNSLGVKSLAAPVGFGVQAVSAGGKTIDIELNTYTPRTIYLGQMAINTGTAMGVLLDQETNRLIPVPTLFGNLGGETIAVIKHRGNGIYTIINNEKTFADLAKHWAKTDVNKIASKLIAHGRDKNTYDPDGKVTRAEFTTLLVRVLGIRDDNINKQFSDVSDQWFAGAVNSAAKVGLVAGYEGGSFRPDARITRQEMAAMVYKAINYAGCQIEVTEQENILSHFRDKDRITGWARTPIAAVVKANIVKGRPDGSFAPDTDATRAESAVMLEHALSFIGFIN